MNGLPMVPNCDFEAGGARRHQAQRVAHPLRRQPEQPAGRDGGAEGAGRRGLVEAALVVDPAQHHADAAGALGAEQEGVAQRRGRGAGALRRGQRRRIDADREMADMGEVGVVIVQRVRDRAVGERRGTGGQALPAADHAGHRRAALRLDVVAQQRPHRLGGAGPAHHHPVEQRQLGQPAGPRGNRAGLERGDGEQPVHAPRQLHGHSRP
ncbi:MAG: hypothetical protein U1E53_07500 [Dongiaceae bacterium]